MKGTGIIILVVVVAVLLGGGWWLWQRAGTPVATPSPSPRPSATSLPNQFIQRVPPEVEGKQMPSGSSMVSAPAATVTISVTDTGFVPSEVEVAAGTKVNFVNDGQALHWPASDTHPTHEKLPGFDAKKGLATGESYAFTFTQVGEWGFHDHLQPQFKGTVKVVGGGIPTSPLPSPY